MRSIAFPAISCGAYGFPARRAADIAMRVMGEELPTCPALERVVFAMRDAAVEKAFRDACRPGEAVPSAARLTDGEALTVGGRPPLP